MAARLQRVNSGIVSIHCVAHRLALAVSQASQSIPYLARFKEILSYLFYFYHNSPVGTYLDTDYSYSVETETVQRCSLVVTPISCGCLKTLFSSCCYQSG